MAVASSSQQSVDPWEQQGPPTSSRRRAPVLPIPDDWENDDDDDEPQNEQDNRRIWDDANVKSPNPMPSLIIAPSSTSSHQVISPPLGAFQPTMRILKRPANSNSNSLTPTPTSLSAVTLEEREAKYQAARERIFGEEGTYETNDSHSLKEKRPPGSQNTPVAVIRNPRGPEGSDSDIRGFGSRSVKRTPDSQKHGTALEEPGMDDYM